MTSTFLQSKLHLLRVTSADLDYEGSLAIDPAIMEAAGVRPFEKILVANRENGARAETYAIPAARGSRTVCMNGAMAHLGKAGDRQRRDDERNLFLDLLLADILHIKIIRLRRVQRRLEDCLLLQKVFLQGHNWRLLFCRLAILYHTGRTKALQFCFR